MPKPGEKADSELTTPDPGRMADEARVADGTGYPDLTPFLKCAQSIGDCVCHMVTPLQSIPAIATAITGLAANVEQQTAVLVKIAEGLGVAAGVPIGTPATWNSKDFETAILAIDQPCKDPAERVARFREAFRLAAAAQPATAAEREVALALAEQLGTRVYRHLVLADQASRPIPPGGC